MTGCPMAILYLGHSEQDARQFEQLIHPEDRQGFQAARAGKPMFDCRMANPSGCWSWTRWILAAGSSQLQGALQELSDRHGEQLIQGRKAETASVLVSGLCHDFNNLIAAIAACAASMEAQGLPEEQRDTVAAIQRAAERAQDLVRQLLDFARKDRDPQKTRHDLNALAREAAALLEHVHAKGVRLDTELSPEPVEAVVEPGQIMQVLLNLGFNALDALSGPGSITLRTGRQQLGPQETNSLDCFRGPYAFLEVEDTGHGIAPEFMDRIYDPFFTTKPSGQGTGLGLAMAQAIVKEHDGLILCESEGRGTRFRVLLPAARNPGPPRELRVLQVEDAELDASLVLAALRAGGFAPRHLRVETAEAMALALAGSWDLILADHFMPRFDGFSALALARERAPGLPFIFVTGALGEAFVERALRTGARDCVPKHRLDLLCPVVERELGRPNGGT